MSMTFRARHRALLPLAVMLVPLNCGDDGTASGSETGSDVRSRDVVENSELDVEESDLTARDASDVDVHEIAILDSDVLPSATISTLFPAAGSACGGQTVVITGSGFDARTEVVFGSVLAEEVSPIDENTLQVTTPASVASTTAVGVMRDGQILDTLDGGFTFLPELDLTGIAFATTGSNLSVVGCGFDTETASANVLSVPSLAGTERRIVGPTPESQVRATFPLTVSFRDSTLTTGEAYVIVRGLRSNGFPIEIEDRTTEAEMAVVSSRLGVEEGTLVLEGVGFSGLTTDSPSGDCLEPLAAVTEFRVCFSGATAPAEVIDINETGTELTVRAPEGARSGPVRFFAPDRVAIETDVVIDVEGTEPVLSVTSFTPEGATPGAVVVINGSGFGAEPVVTFEDVPAHLLSIERRRIVAVVPDIGFGPADLEVTEDDESASGGVFSVVGGVEIVAGAGLQTSLRGDGGDPRDALIVATFVAVDDDGTFFIADGVRIRAVNNTVQALGDDEAFFGIEVASNTIETVYVTDPEAKIDESPFSVTAIAVHPETQDLFYAANNSIYRIRRLDGEVELYAGTGVPGFSGDSGPRLEATFEAITDLRFSSDATFLVVGDNRNQSVRAINTSDESATRWGVSLGPDTIDEIERVGTGNPIGLSLDAFDNIYATKLFRLVRIQTDGTVDSFPTPGTNAGVALWDTRNAGESGEGELYVYLGSRDGVVRTLRAGSSGDTAEIDEEDPVAAAFGIPDTIGFSGDGGSATDAVLGLQSRPFMDIDGAILLAADGRIRRVEVERPAETIGRIDTVVGIGPEPLTDGMNGADVPFVVSRSVGFDESRNQYLYGVGSYLVGQEAETGVIAVLAGTGIPGTTIAEDDSARDSTLAPLRAFVLDEDLDALYLLHSTLPRVSRIQLADDPLNNTIEILSTDVSITTGLPQATIGPDGFLYFANRSTVRVINILDTNGANIEGTDMGPGEMLALGTVFPDLVNGLTFDQRNNLFASIGGSASGLVVRWADAPDDEPAASVIEVTSDRFGTDEGGTTLSNLRLSDPGGLSFTPDGSLLVADALNNRVVLIEDLVELDGDTPQVNTEARVVSVFGNGATGEPIIGATAVYTPVDRAYAAQVVCHAEDRCELLVSTNGQIFSVGLP